ncbi:MAG: 30S ribosomal protein S13 [Candidatus Peregrinibacteria bacterium]|nr:30S ribosomal protein S13 [Candidatus Peregrinibacteria bacterium]
MARIAGVNLPKEKRVEIGLTAIYGVGRNLSKQILTEAKIDFNKKVEVLTEPEIASIREILVRFATEGDLKRKIAMDIKRLQEIGTYRGLRHKKGLPVRGQRTRYNCRTRKGKRKTVANKKIIAK